MLVLPLSGVYSGTPFIRRTRRVAKNYIVLAERSEVVSCESAGLYTLARVRVFLIITCT